MAEVVTYNGNFPTECTKLPALFAVGGAAQGMTDGGVGFDPEKTIEAIMPDGARSYLKGLIQTSKYGGKLTGKLWQFASATQMAILEPGATVDVGVAPVTNTITPKDAGLLYADGDYLTNVRLIWENVAGAAFFILQLPIAFVAKYSFPAGGEGRMSIAFEMWPVNDPAVSMVAAPYKMFTATSAVLE